MKWIIKCLLVSFTFKGCVLFVFVIVVVDFVVILFATVFYDRDKSTASYYVD